MATSEEYLTFVCEQIARFGAVRYRKMFGDATVYLDDKPILLVCDNTVFVKCLPETAALLSDAGTGTAALPARHRQRRAARRAHPRACGVHPAAKAEKEKGQNLTQCRANARHLLL